jgi:hypothetical protein
MATNFEKPLTGFNHNIKHKGKVYHVQTEDSGVANPHIVTHLFVGGNILASKRNSYAENVTAENLSEVVRELMEKQHKEMLRNLINGAYDHLDTAQAAAHYQPGQIAAAQGAKSWAPLPLLNPVPPEVVAARAMPVAPELKESRAETLFGEDLISDKSLDEVILSYLAGDDEP